MNSLPSCLIFNEKRVSLPVLYKKNANGKVQIWEVAVYLLSDTGKKQKIDQDYLQPGPETSALLPKGSRGVIFVRWGVQGGQIQTATEHIAKGKNIGRSNETNPFSQAVAQAVSTWTKKQERNNYTLNPGQVERTIISPMLLKKFEEAKQHIKYPAFISPKFDGSRMLAYYSPNEKRFVLVSRTGNEFIHLRHIREDLAKIPFLIKDPNWIVDGEAYSPDITFEEIQQICRKSLDLETEDLRDQTKIKYYIFDIFNIKDPSIPFRDRYKLLQDIFEKHKGQFKYLVLVPQHVVHNEDEAMAFHKKMVIQKEEGSVIRNIDAPYEIGKRSQHIQKIKDFVDAEFPIIGFKEGKGKNVGTIIFKVRTKDGKEFDVVPEGSYEQRRKWYQDGNKLIGKLLTVRFKELSAYGVPRFPIGVAIRDYEGPA